MKVNLIYDMRSGFSDNFDSYTNEERGEAVLAVLESSRHTAEFKKIIKGLEEPSSTRISSVYVDDLITEEQQIKYNVIKQKFIL